MSDQKVRLLILGGTTEAAALARRVDAERSDRIAVTTSLAGRLPVPPNLPGAVRAGGFGGAEGLAAYLAEAGIDLLVDATHPFAAAISREAAEACAARAVPRLMLVRPPWVTEPGDDWQQVDSFAEAAALLPGLARRVFLATGPGGAAAFAPLAEIWFLLRLFAPQATPLPLARYETIIARPPFTLEGETALLACHRIEALVCKNSGGPTDAKLAAARAAGLPVLILRRPPLPAGEVVVDASSAMLWLGRRVATGSTEGCRPVDRFRYRR